MNDEEKQGEKKQDKKKQTVNLPGFRSFATSTAERLGDGWTLDPDTTSGPVAFLTHPDGHRVGLRRLWHGQAVQTWATDVPPREYTNEDDAKVMAANAVHLTEGTRYNVGVVFTHNPPAAATAKNIRTRLLPAYDGVRPPLRAFPRKRTRAAPTAQATTTAKPRRRPSPTTEPTAKPRSRKPRSTKAQPTTPTNSK